MSKKNKQSGKPIWIPGDIIEQWEDQDQMLEFLRHGTYFFKQHVRMRPTVMKFFERYPVFASIFKKKKEDDIA